MQEYTRGIDSSVDDDKDVSLRDIVKHIKDWWGYFKRKWLTLLVAAVLGSTLGGLYASYNKPTFFAETSFVLEDDNAGGGMLGQLGGLAGIAGIDVGGGGGLFQGDNIIQLYKSRSMVEKTLLSKVKIGADSILLIDRYIDANNLEKAWESTKTLKNLSFSNSGRRTRIQDSVLGVIVKNINKNSLFVTKPDKKLSIISVLVKSSDEYFAKAFNNKIVENVNDFYVQTKTKKALENLAIIQKQTDSVRNVLNSALYQTAAVSDATPNLNPTRQVLRTPALRSQFNAEANKAILTQLVQNLELAKLSLRKETPLIQIIDEPVYPLYKEQKGIISSILLGMVACVVVAVVLLTVARLYQQLMLESEEHQ